MNSYAGRRVVVTGGLGFIGSNLAIRLVELGADVTIIDSLEMGCGGNVANIAPAAGKVEVVDGDIGDAVATSGAISNADLVLNLAGEVSHTHSMAFPGRDLEINALAQMCFVQTCARLRPGIRVVYTSTRQVYGKPRYSPVDEAHPVVPIDFNGVHKHAAELYHLMLTTLGTLDAVILRFSNVYGPRMGIHIKCQGVLPVFFRNALLGHPVQIFGSGTQSRDPLYVDDAVEAILLAGSSQGNDSRTYNIGGGQSYTLGEIAEVISASSGGPPPKRIPMPADRAEIDIGNFEADCSRVARELGWTPNTSLELGVRKTSEFFRTHRDDYFQSQGSAAACPLHAPHLLPARAAKANV